MKQEIPHFKILLYSFKAEMKKSEKEKKKGHNENGQEFLVTSVSLYRIISTDINKLFRKT